MFESLRSGSAKMNNANTGNAWYKAGPEGGLATAKGHRKIARKLQNKSEAYRIYDLEMNLVRWFASKADGVMPVVDMQE